MASRCLLLFFVFLSLTGLSDEECHDHFSIEHWNGTDMTDLITLVNATSTEKILNCTVWKNKNRTLFYKIDSDCFKDLGLKEMCNQTTEGKHKIHAFHFRCLYAKLLNVNYSAPSAKDIYGDCQNFGSEINTLQQLWNNLDNDGTSAGVTSASPPNTSTLCSTTTMTTSTPTMSSSLGATTSTTSPTTTSSGRTTTLTSPPTPSTSTPTATSTSTPTIPTSRNTTTSTTSPTTTSSGRTTTLTSPPTPSTSTPTTTSTSTPTIPTSRNTTSLTTSPATTSTSRRTTTSTRSPPTTSKLSLTTQSTAKGKTQLSNAATRQSPTDFDPCLPCSLKSVPHMGQRTEKSTHTWQTTSILVVLMLSITGNLMQGLNSFLQKRKLNMKQKQMSAECICLNPDTTAAEKSPKKSLSYSNESVH